MKRFLLLILSSLGLVSSSPAQHYFNLRDAFHSQSTILTSVVERDHRYYVTGLCIDSINYVGNNTFNNIEGVKFAILDSAGNKILDTFYQKDFPKQFEPWNSNCLYSMPDGGFILASQFLDSDIHHGYIIKFDSIGKMLWEKQYNQPVCTDNNWYITKDLKPIGTGEWLMLSEVRCNYNATDAHDEMLLEKLDSDFNVIWSKAYGNPPDNHSPSRILIDQDGFLLVGGINNTNLVANGNYFQPELIRVDTAGTWKWTWIRGMGGYYNAPNDIIRTSDGGYIYCGGGDGFIDFEPNFKGWVEKLDSGRNIVWHKSFNQYYWTTQFKAVKEMPNGDILLFGDKYCPYWVDSTHVNMHTKGWYMKLNANGDSLAEHTYYHLRTCSDENNIYDAKQTTDGGFIMVGESTDYCGGAQSPTQRGWIIKTDSNGCIDPINCDQQDTSTGVEQVASARSDISVYPNPVQDFLQIDYINIASGEITILDMTGRVLLNQKLEHHIDLKQLASGVYLYRITENGIIRGQGKVVKE